MQEIPQARLSQEELVETDFDVALSKIMDYEFVVLESHVYFSSKRQIFLGIAFGFEIVCRYVLPGGAYIYHQVGDRSRP